MKSKIVSIICVAGFQVFTSALCAQVITSPGDKLISSTEASGLADQANTKLQSASSKEDFESAAELLAQAASRDPANMEVRKSLGWVYLEKLHKPKLAYPYLLTLSNSRTNDPEAFTLFGMACAQTGRLTYAVRAFRKADHVKPDDPWIRANLARNLARLGHYYRAGRIYRDILRLNPNYNPALLGQAELAAWHGHSAGPLKTLDQILEQEPANADALVLEGDIHRWNWDVTEARADYNRALESVPDDTDAKKGLNDADRQADSNLTLKGYWFYQSTKFEMYSAEADMRVHLADKVYLVYGAAGWRFTNPGFNPVDSVVGFGGLEFDFNRWFQMTAEGTGFDYEHRDPIPGARVSIKTTPVYGLDIYTIGSFQDPFTTSMPAVVDAIKQDSVGNGIDWKIIGPLSIQNSLEIASLSDYNNWWEDKPQLSFHLWSVPAIDLRVQYDHLTYSQARTNYWAPNDWNTVAPVLDITAPLVPHVHLNLDGQMPYVFVDERFGYIGQGGLTIDFASWCQLKASYIYAHIPGTLGANSVPWSGQGAQASLVFKF